jgi:hypothetical protein
MIIVWFFQQEAGLFFKKYLAEEIKKPVWTPVVMTINDLFRHFQNCSGRK